MKILLTSTICAISLFGAEFNADMKAYIDELKASAKAENSSFVDFDAARGQKIFGTKNIGKDGKELSCYSCHGNDLTKPAQNVFTGKSVEPLAPSANKTRLSDVDEVKKWLKRNFKDVFLREGTALEKGDVLYFLIKQ